MSVAGLDVGNDTLVAAAARQRGIDVLLNAESNSKREWPAVVAFSHSARLLGAHAAGAASSHAPSSSPKRLLLLGRRRPGAAPPRTARPSLAHAPLPARPARIASRSTPARPDKGQGRRRRDAVAARDGDARRTAVGRACVSQQCGGAESFATSTLGINYPEKGRTTLGEQYYELKFTIYDSYSYLVSCSIASLAVQALTSTINEENLPDLKYQFDTNDVDKSGPITALKKYSKENEMMDVAGASLACIALLALGKVMATQEP
ncbi:heat shock 70 kDa protein 16 [Hordeum vulgare]|nr:heat shock 70 kDa protein 16 [Hordeum vulgare]